jgi:carbamate kinase
VILAEAMAYATKYHFSKGSKLPKIQAVICSLEHGGKYAFITNPEKITGRWMARSAYGLCHNNFRFLEDNHRISILQ